MLHELSIINLEVYNILRKLIFSFNCQYSKNKHKFAQEENNSTMELKIFLYIILENKTKQKKLGNVL